MNFLQGKKTYIVGALLVILSGLKAQGIVDENMYQVLLALFMGSGLAALRYGMTNGTPKT